MRVLVLFAHPVETSYGAALHRAVVEELRRPPATRSTTATSMPRISTAAMTRQERLDYQEVGPNRGHVERYVQRLLAAEALVVVLPGLELRLSGDPQGLPRPRLPARRLVQAGQPQGAAVAVQHQEMRLRLPPMAAPASAPG